MIKGIVGWVREGKHIGMDDKKEGRGGGMEDKAVGLHCALPLRLGSAENCCQNHGLLLRSGTVSTDVILLIALNTVLVMTGTMCHFLAAFTARLLSVRFASPSPLLVW